MSVGKKKIKREVVRSLKKQDWASELVKPPKRLEPSERTISQKTIEMFSEDKIQPLRALRAKQLKAKRNSSS